LVVRSERKDDVINLRVERMIILKEIYEGVPRNSRTEAIA
jgi:hypothetical protein